MRINCQALNLEQYETYESSVIFQKTLNPTLFCLFGANLRGRRVRWIGWCPEVRGADYCAALFAGKALRVRLVLATFNAQL